MKLNDLNINLSYKTWNYHYENTKASKDYFRACFSLEQVKT